MPAECLSAETTGTTERESEQIRGFQGPRAIGGMSVPPRYNPNQRE